ncbi:ATP-binding protein [Bibersteinia trehalosi]|uniref:ATP-binding protein n=1 Tax=Bibersteinia trehalosi TaxID=47735 RepID=A0A3R8N0A5_BIBTR|nr:ATP-binding protein [Bibersteinia trehalosi]RRN03736.1 ATP-binding protein [Bibersteinia trehalosi]
MSNWFSPSDITRRIGSLIEISATEAKINLTKAGTGEQVWLLGNRIPIGEVNEYVFIDCGQDCILGRVIKVWLENGERLSVDSLDDSYANNNPIGLVQLLVSVDTETGFNRKGIRQYPKLGAQIYSAHPKLVSLLAEGKVNNDSDEIELPIAEITGDSSVTINLTPEKLFSRHCAILGSTGGGKSYTMANLINNIYQKGGKVLLLDATGEYANLPCESYYVGEHPNATNKNKVTYPHWMFTDSDIRALLRPSAQSQAPKLNAAINSLKILENVTLHKLKTDTNGNLIKSNQKKEDFYQAELSLNSIIQYHKKWKFKLLSRQIIEECVRPDAKYGNDKTSWGDYLENDIGYCLSLISRIDDMSNNPNLNWMLDCEDSLETIPKIIDDLCSSDNKMVRLDLSAVPFEANARELLVNAIGRKLLSCAREGKISHEEPLLVFIDEAHQFLNKSIGDEISKMNLTAFGDIAKEGRKYGLNVTIATQRPRDIPEDVLSQIGTLIVHRLTNEKDQDIVKKAVGSIDYRSASFLPVLGQGEGLLLGVDFPFPMKVKIKTPDFKPESKSASFSKSWKIKKQLSV